MLSYCQTDYKVSHFHFRFFFLWKGIKFNITQWWNISFKRFNDHQKLESSWIPLLETLHHYFQQWRNGKDKCCSSIYDNVQVVKNHYNWQKHQKIHNTMLNDWCVKMCELAVIVSISIDHGHNILYQHLHIIKINVMGAAFVDAFKWIFLKSTWTYFITIQWSSCNDLSLLTKHGFTTMCQRQNSNPDNGWKQMEVLQRRFKVFHQLKKWRCLFFGTIYKN